MRTLRALLLLAAGFGLGLLFAGWRASDAYDRAVRAQERRTRELQMDPGTALRATPAALDADEALRRALGR